MLLVYFPELVNWDVGFWRVKVPRDLELFLFVAQLADRCIIHYTLHIWAQVLHHFFVFVHHIYSLLVSPAMSIKVCHISPEMRQTTGWQTWSSPILWAGIVSHIILLGSQYISRMGLREFVWSWTTPPQKTWWFVVMFVPYWNCQKLKCKYPVRGKTRIVGYIYGYIRLYHIIHQLISIPWYYHHVG